jgi:hypothetical protein
MQTITEIFRTYGPEYIELYGKDMPSGHQKTIQAIIQCRTQIYGMTLYQCPDCGQIHHVFRSCGNRHCPQCQHHKTRQWLEKQLDRQVPCPHFLITFTVPQELRHFSGKSHRHLQISEARQFTIPINLPRRHGVHQAFSPAYPPLGIYEGQAFRIYELTLFPQC